LRASPPGLVQTAVVNKIVVFVDNKSRERRRRRRRRRPSPAGTSFRLRESPGLFRDIDHVSREFVRPRSDRAIAKPLLLARRPEPSPPPIFGGDFFYFCFRNSLLVSRQRCLGRRPSFGRRRFSSLRRRSFTIADETMFPDGDTLFYYRLLCADVFMSSDAHSDTL